MSSRIVAAASSTPPAKRQRKVWTPVVTSALSVLQCADNLNNNKKVAKMGTTVGGMNANAGIIIISSVQPCVALFMIRMMRIALKEQEHATVKSLLKNTAKPACPMFLRHRVCVRAGQHSDHHFPGSMRL